jgi:hypothetical protein
MSMKRFVLTLTVVAALSALWSSAAQAQYGYYGTFRGGRTPTVNHVRSLNTGGVFIQSYAPPPGYGYYGEAYGYGYGPTPGFGVEYGYRPGWGHAHQRGYAPYGYGGFPSGGRW